MTPEERKVVDDKNIDKKEFPYIEKLVEFDKLPDTFQDDYDAGKIVFCDPGKRSPLFLMASNNVMKDVTSVTGKRFKDTKKETPMKLDYFGVSSKAITMKSNQIKLANGETDKVYIDKPISNHKFMNYTTNTRIKFTKRKIYGKLIENWKQSKPSNYIAIKGPETKKTFKTVARDNIWLAKTIKDIETELARLNSKSCNHDTFLEYVKLKLVLLEKVRCQYNTEKLEKLKWFSYLNKLHHENNLIRKIQSEFGKDITIIFGDWSGKGNLKFISTPNISLKRKLREHFKVYSIDEYCTSCIHYTAIDKDKRCKNISALVKDRSIKVEPKKKEVNNIIKRNPYNKVTRKNAIKKVPIPDDDKVLRDLHAVLTSEIVKEGVVCKKTLCCINRDKNSVLNMERIVSNLLTKKCRPDLFTRNQLNLKDSVKRVRKGKSLDATCAKEMLSHDPTKKTRSKTSNKPTSLKTKKVVSV